MKTYISLLFLFIGLQINAQALKQDHIPGELILMLHKGETIASFETALDNARMDHVALKFEKTLFSALNIHLMTFDENQILAKKLLADILALPAVKSAELNRVVSYRDTTPDDSLYVEQWNLELINAPAIWDITTGGKTGTNDEIVIVVIDEGFAPEHPDFADNLWVNPGEIADDNLDNDNNGKIDDYYGWNWDNWNDDHPYDEHGTGICGITSATGNNGIGISGVNWNAKTMLISQADRTNEIIEAYEYILEFRKKYNETNGQEGAFIVAVNASWGIDEAFCDQTTVWNELYEEMGAEGILNVGATINSNINVDEKGDIPTSCPSDYLISLTNTNKADEKVAGAGYGPVSIDMGAPGQEIISLVGESGYGNIGSGTSFSTPHVTAAIALLYSIACDKISELSALDPAQSALQIKSFILNGGQELASLSGVTATGKRLDLAGSMNQMREFCDGAVGELGFVEVSPNPTGGLVELKIQTPELGNYQVRVFNAIGQEMYNQRLEPIDYFAKLYTLDISHLAAGVYFVSISTLRQISTVKIVVY